MPAPELDEAEGQGSGRASTGATGVLIVDDSDAVRLLLRRVIDSDPGLRVVGEATDGNQALTVARTLRPDVVVLDIQLPGLDGLTVLDKLSQENIGARVVVFANVEPEDLARIDQRVRSAGAELVPKPTGVADVAEALIKIRECLLDSLRRPMERRPMERRPGVGRRSVDAVVIASSTGGPNALEIVLRTINDLRVPVFIVQHIADGFSGRLADRLDHLSSFSVREVVDGQRPAPGHVYISPGGIHLVIERDVKGPVMRLRNRPPVNSCRPSADVLFTSSAEVYGGNQVGLVLTGIGRDGRDGCRALSALGAPILVQDEASSVVWGMPGAVAKAGLADEVLPIESIGARIQHLTLAGLHTPRGERSQR